MKVPEHKPEKNSRLELNAFGMLDIDEEKEFTALTKIAADLCQAKMSFVTFLENDKLWFKSLEGFGLEKGFPAASIDSLAIQNPLEAIVIPDLRRDGRFAGNALGSDNEAALSYAGVPLVSHSGIAIGLLNLVHDAAQHLSEEQIDSLKAMGRQVVNLLELRKLTSVSQKLERARLKLKNLYNINLDLIIVVDSNGVVVNVNRAVESLLGYAYDDLTKAELMQFVHPDDLNNTLKAISRLREEELITRFRCRIKHKDGHYHTIEWQAAPSEEGFLASGRDITEQLAFEQHLRNSLALNNAITGALDSSTIVSIADLQGNILRANRVFCQISGYSEDELLGQNHRIINSGYHAKSFWVEMWRTISKGQTWRAEVCNRAKDGSIYWVDTVINPIYNSKGKVYQYYAIRYLITERKKMEKELKEQRQLLEQIGQFSRVGGYEINLVNKTLNWSAVTKEIHEVPADFVPDKENPTVYFKSGESRDKFMDLYTRAVREGESFEAELQIVTAKGNELWVKVHGKPEMKEGKCQRIYGTIQDINREKI